jgi:rhomboid protease GluP
VLNHGQWVRVLTATFMHLNPLHLIINMWCLWNLGLLGEPLLGRRGLVCVYMLTGIAGNLCSLGFNSFMKHDGMVVGASGAIFGISGILIVLLSNKRLSLPWEELRSLRRSVVQFAVLNVLIGIAPQIIMGMTSPKSSAHASPQLEMLTHVDNMAHLGGLFCGLLMGLPLFPRMLTGRASYRERQSLTFAVTAFALMLFAYSISKFHGH